MCILTILLCFLFIMVMTHHGGDFGLGSGVEPRDIELCELFCRTFVAYLVKSRRS